MRPLMFKKYLSSALFSVSVYNIFQIIIIVKLIVEKCQEWPKYHCSSYQWLIRRPLVSTCMLQNITELSHSGIYGTSTLL